MLPTISLLINRTAAIPIRTAIDAHDMKTVFKLMAIMLPEGTRAFRLLPTATDDLELIVSKTGGFEDALRHDGWEFGFMGPWYTPCIDSRK